MTLRILVATDLSAPSRHAVDRACRLAAEHAATPCFVHAINPGLLDSLQRMLGGDAPALVDRLTTDARQQLTALAADPQHALGLTTECAVVEGSPVIAIARHAEEIDAGLLVVGSRGEGFLRQSTLGTTASRLLRKTPRPTLVVRQPPHESYRRALVAMDFSPAALLALAQTRRWAPQAELVLLHAVDLPFEGKLLHANVDPDLIQRYRIQAQLDGMNRLRALAREQELPASTRLLALHGDAPRLILEQEQENDCDLIALGKRGFNALEDLLLGSTTKHVLGETLADVLLTR